MATFRLLPVAVALNTLLACSSQAQDLLTLYESARSVDASFQSARAQYDANMARAAQAEAVLYPTANLSANVNRNLFDSNNPVSSRTSLAQGTTVSGNYPLYRPANDATLAQGRKILELAEAQLQVAAQDLMIRVSQAYFDVLASVDSLTFVRAQKAAVAEQLASAKRNFEVGTSTITDTREAQARFDLVIAQEIATENDLRVKRLALDQLVGKSGAEPVGLPSPVLLPPPGPQDVNAWVAAAVTDHPALRQAQTNLDIAQLEIRRAEAAKKPTVDLVASYTRTYNNGSSTSALTSITQGTTIGVQLNYPLFTGYASDNRIKETLALEEKARADLEVARRSISQTVRAAYFGVISGLGQVQALQAAEASSQSALEANKLGYSVGVRINIDVLNAQSQLFQTKRDLAKARYDVLVGGLRLRQANGSLQAADLANVNKLLAP